MPLTRRRFLGAGSALLALLPLMKPALAATPATLRLRILSTTDLHGYIAPYDYYRDFYSDRLGLARLASLIRAARQEAPNTLLFDNGDLLAGNPLTDYIAREKGLNVGDIHPVYKAMNLLGFDAATLGNHDFNPGLPFLERALSGANFPYVLANLCQAGSDAPYFHPYTILDRDIADAAGGKHRLRIGVTGVTPPQVSVWARRQLSGKIEPRDIADTVRRTVPEMKAKGADLVVVLAHTGLNPPPAVKGEENAAWSLTTIPDVDVVITGHSHRVFPDAWFANLPGYDASAGTLNGRPVVMPGFFGSHLGVIDLDLTPGPNGFAVNGARAETRALHETAAATDPEIMKAIEADHRATLGYVRRPVGRLSQPVNSYFDLVAPSRLLAVIAAAQAWGAHKARQEYPELFAGHAGLPILSAVAPFKSGKRRPGAGSYVDIPAGDISLGHIADLYTYPNVLTVVEIDGAALREWLEMSATIFRQIHQGRARAQTLIAHDFPVFDFDVIHGVQYGIDVTQPARYHKGGDLIAPEARRIADLAFAGKPVADRDRFLVATNNYRAGGGGNFPGMDGGNIVFHSPDQMQDMLVEWFRAEGDGTVDATAPWRFVDLPQSATIVFETSPDAVRAMPAGAGLTYVETTEDGFAKFSVQQA